MVTGRETMRRANMIWHLQLAGPLVAEHADIMATVTLNNHNTLRHLVCLLGLILLANWTLRTVFWPKSSVSSSHSDLYFNASARAIHLRRSSTWVLLQRRPRLNVADFKC